MRPAASSPRTPARARPAILASLAAMAILLATLVPATAAPSAADPAPTPTASPAPRTERAARSDQDPGQRLAKAFELMQTRLTKQQERLDWAGRLAGRAQSWLDQGKAEKYDTAALETALAAFKSALASAQASHDRAQSILDAGAGFDEKGKVTDAAQARTTLQTAGQAMREAGRTMGQALVDLREVLSTVILAERLDRQRDWLAKQQERLDRAGALVARVQALIDEQRSQGKNPQRLEKALADFNAALASARASHDQAGKTLENPAGFDAGGNVTDVEQARATLRTAGQAMREAARILWEGIQDLRKVARELRPEVERKTARQG